MSSCMAQRRWHCAMIYTIFSRQKTSWASFVQLSRGVHARGGSIKQLYALLHVALVFRFVCCICHARLLYSFLVWTQIYWPDRVMPECEAQGRFQLWNVHPACILPFTGVNVVVSPLWQTFLCSARNMIRWLERSYIWPLHVNKNAPMCVGQPS